MCTVVEIKRLEQHLLTGRNIDYVPLVLFKRIDGDEPIPTQFTATTEKIISKSEVVTEMLDVVVLMISIWLMVTR